MFVIARTVRRRPTLMHTVVPGSQTLTKCGISMIGWSRAYFHEPIPQVLCMKCKGR